MRSKISGIWATGVATSTMSASPISCAGLIPARSITPNSCAVRKVDGVRPKPTTSSTASASFKASEKEPPIRPVPKTTILPNSAIDLQRLLQRFQEAGIFRLGTDRDTQPLRHAVTADRPDDDTLFQQLLVHCGTIPHLEGDEITMRLNVIKPLLFQTGDDLHHPALIQFVAGLQEFIVVQGGQCAGQR